MVLSLKYIAPASCVVILVASGCTCSYKNTVSRASEGFSSIVPSACSVQDQQYCDIQVLSLRDPQREVVYATRADVVITTGAPQEDQGDDRKTAASNDSANTRKTIDNNTLESAPTLGQ